MLIGADPEIPEMLSTGTTPVCASPPNFLYGVSVAMRALERMVADIAPTGIPVLLDGESGTGKEVVALEFHRRSSRRDQAFLKCSCGITSTESLTSHQSQPANSRDETAGQGTIFFDEVNQLDSVNQDCLLKLLPDGNRLHPQTLTGTRLISATTRNLEKEMHAGRFSPELYYRLNGVYLKLPPLRDRKEDIPLLLDLFLTKYSSLFCFPKPHLGSSTINLLLEQPWPGNVRELENFARRAVALQDEQLALGEMAPNRTTVAATNPKPAVPSQRRKLGSLKEASREASRKVERELILKTLERTHWNRKRTARELQISYKALLYKLKQLGLDGAGNPPLTADA
jgi:two-component system response regulator AtoC